ncbi:glycoside hydrolase family 88 protein [Paenibacillus sp. ATY16]|uniref:glycoside hydrolase family 88 protein n=1 Tax=Paenibacillus sp. ATY16 TaxID=1759312 RepID=UPI00200F2B95|nr:glycoside hydrolase family 88 protein [Paenibacillus sp. ATY16]MCK9860069.1 glycoside hydrolase family 88 protein [Paenibacillus sp. ATY16]
MWKTAIEGAIATIASNIDRFGDSYPHVGEGSRYTRIENNDWTNGFWSGLLWLGYEYSGDKRLREAARKTTASFRQRLKDNVVLDHHDIGFLYSLSAKAEWIVEGSETAKELALAAADVMMKRWRKAGGYFQAWGPEGDPVEGGRIIIDCLLNLPLLYWASEQTGNPVYKEAAKAQAEKSRRYLVRGDDSSYHTFFFDQQTGEPVGGATHQGFGNGSTWTRGQAWGIYGFALSYRYTRDPLFLETSKRMAVYFLEHLPEDGVAYWDFHLPEEQPKYRDSSASAIAAAGLAELLSHLDQKDTAFKDLRDGLQYTMEALVSKYSTNGDGTEEGLLKHGSYHVRGGLAPDDYMIWGDYFYLEALLRLERGIDGYWYERNRDRD